MNKVKVVLDTNILISAVGFGGKPRTIIGLILEENIKGVTTNLLIAELEDVITKKFPNLTNDFILLNKQIQKKFDIVKPQKHLQVVRDEDDNRVLEAAIEGNCQFIITGDKDLLDLKVFQNIQVVTTDQFLLTFQS